jgi:hypothetical protein
VRNAQDLTLSSVNHFLRSRTKCRHSIRILKSAILPLLPLSKSVDAHNLEGSAPETRRLSKKLNLGCWMCKASDYRKTFSRNATVRSAAYS